jgi:hypothetical protein
MRVGDDGVDETWPIGPKFEDRPARIVYATNDWYVYNMIV